MNGSYQLIRIYPAFFTIAQKNSFGKCFFNLIYLLFIN